MPLLIHDTLSRTKRPFTPRDPKRVTLYVCGPTVYSYAHIGNARPVVVFDVLFRLLRRLYGEQAVVYARNVTDVDDKINAAAIAEGVPISTITDRYLAVYEADMAALGALAPTVQPHATAHIPQMLDQIGRLVEADAAYAAEGHVLFRVRAFPAYGELSGRSLDDMVAGARVEVAPYKDDPADFVLWKPSKPGEPEWPSPWGSGRPGWHIECSAMIESVLGLPVDIHGGGHDLIFPHHTNEVAQGCRACGSQAPTDYARYWMHNGFLTLDREKMSKSAGGTLQVHDLIATVPGEALRWALLSTHYRAPLDWTDELLDRSRRSVERLRQTVREAVAVLRAQPDFDRLWARLTQTRDAVLADISTFPEMTRRSDWRAALLDDLNTAVALQDLERIAGRVQRRRNLLVHGQDGAAPLDVAVETGMLLAAATVLLGWDDDLVSRLEDTARGPPAPETDAATATRVDALLAARAEARKAKDWPAADRIRDEIAALGVEVVDGPGGTVNWRMKD